MMPLKGIKVLEFVGLAPVPFCGKILQDFGAKVLRVDNVFNPFGSELQMFTTGKDTIKLNLKTSQGVDIVNRLVGEQKYDVLLDPFRPGVLERLQLGPEQLHRLNPALVYARISGYGQTGPYRTVGGHDINYLAMSGVLSRLGARTGAPIAPINLLGDFAGGSVLCALGICMALFDRTRTGMGQVVDQSMTEGAAYIGSFLWETLHRQSQVFWPNYPQRAANLLDSGAPWYRCYECADHKYIAVGAIEEKFYQNFLSTIGWNSSGDPNEEYLQYDIERWDEFGEKIAQIIRTKTRDEWIAKFDGVDACVTPVLELDETPHHVLHQQRNAFNTNGDDNTHHLPEPSPRLLSSSSQPLSTSSTRSGTNDTKATVTKKILKELGYTEKQIEQMINDNVID